MIIGTLPPPIGGTSVLLKCLVDELNQRDDIELCVVDTSAGEKRGRWVDVMRFFKLVYEILCNIKHVDVVSFHGVKSKMHFAGTIVYLLTRIWRRPFIIRMFGGENYTLQKGVRVRIVHWLMRKCHLCLVETKALVKALEESGINSVKWYPNNRPAIQEDNSEKRICRQHRKFIYLSHVRESKGIFELIAAAQKADFDIEIDVYGPFYDGLQKQDIEVCPGLRYCGVVSPGDVDDVLREYDIFLLPTHHKGEGYPGVVLEAYRAGLPVIATDWQAIPEIVDQTSGVLIPPYDSEALLETMRRLAEDDALFVKLREGARQKELLFDSKQWAFNFVDYCNNLLKSE